MISPHAGKPGIFLTARWRHLAVLNYAVDQCLLKPYLLPGLELDFWRGSTYISLVAFLFQNTRVCALPIPFHRTFPEVNLRFYVKRALADGERRGVVFIREIVPRRAVAYVARKFYGEKYMALPMHAEIDADHRFRSMARRARFEWRLKSAPYSLEAASAATPSYPEPESLVAFIIEHYWGYSAGSRRVASCIEYQVEHPRWMVRPADHARFTGDAALLYGQRFAEVLSRRPDSAFLVDGSAVRVRHGVELK